MTMGPTGAGKSRAIETLLDSLTVLKAPHKQMRMNPKVINCRLLLIISINTEIFLQ